MTAPEVTRNVTVGGGRAVHRAVVYLNGKGKVTGGYTVCGSEGRTPGSSRIRPTDSAVTCKRCPKEN